MEDCEGKYSHWTVHWNMARMAILRYIYFTITNEVKREGWSCVFCFSDDCVCIIVCDHQYISSMEIPRGFLCFQTPHRKQMQLRTGETKSQALSSSPRLRTVLFHSSRRTLYRGFSHHCFPIVKTGGNCGTGVVRNELDLCGAPSQAPWPSCLRSQYTRSSYCTLPCVQRSMARTFFFFFF